MHMIYKKFGIFKYNKRPKFVLKNRDIVSKRFDYRIKRIIEDKEDNKIVIDYLAFNSEP